MVDIDDIYMRRREKKIKITDSIVIHITTHMKITVTLNMKFIYTNTFHTP